MYNDKNNKKKFNNNTKEKERVYFETILSKIRLHVMESA